MQCGIPWRTSPPTHLHTHALAHTHTPTPAHTHTPTLAHTHPHPHTHLLSHTPAHSHTHTHTHTHRPGSRCTGKWGNCGCSSLRCRETCVCVWNLQPERGELLRGHSWFVHDLCQASLSYFMPQKGACGDMFGAVRNPHPMACMGKLPARPTGEHGCYGR